MVQVKSDQLIGHQRLHPIDDYGLERFDVQRTFLQPSRHYIRPRCYVPHSLCGAILLIMFAALNLRIGRETMFGLVMLVALVILTVASPYAVTATAKAKSRRR